MTDRADPGAARLAGDRTLGPETPRIDPERKDPHEDDGFCEAQSVRILDPLNGSDRPEEAVGQFLDAFQRLVVPADFQPIGEPRLPGRALHVHTGRVDVLVYGVSPTRIRTVPHRLPIDGGFVFDLVTDGEYLLKQGGPEIRATAGAAVAGPRLAPAEITSPGASRHQTLVIPEAAIAGAIGPVDRPSQLIPAAFPEMRIIAGYLAEIGRAASAGTAVPTVSGHHLVELVVSALARAGHSDDPTEGQALRRGRLAEIRRLVAEHAPNPSLNVTRVARSLGVTDRYVQILMRESGTTFSDYLREQRLQRAYERLTRDRNPSLSVREIAESCGFTDQAQFTRAFRHRFADTPGAVRAEALRL